MELTPSPQVHLAPLGFYALHNVITNEIVPSNKQFRSFKLEVWHVKRKGKCCCLHCIVVLFLVNATDLSHPHGPPPFGLVFPANICLYFTLRDRSFVQ